MSDGKNVVCQQEVGGTANTRLSVLNDAKNHGRFIPSCTYKTVSDAVKGAAGGMGIKTTPVKGSRCPMLASPTSEVLT